ncbi:MAG: citrate synthase, partial [Phycisphaeraceae bacterium]|nr:citrate synthase [Phycisphaeraceae bacterium]
MSTATEKQFDQGLVNTIAAETQMSFIDGEKGILEYVGIDIDSLARNSTFEESTYLLWNGRLPNPAELAAFEQELRAEYELPAGVLDMIRATPADASTMHTVQTLVSSLSL